MIHRILATLRELRARSILVGGWIAFMIYAWPGYLGWDSVTQLVQARAGHYTDDHPPAMAVLWRLLEHVVRGPALMLVLISVTFLAGVYLLLAKVMSERRAAWFAIAILAFPPVGTLLAVVLKDCLMAGFVLLGLPFLLGDGRRRWLGLALFAVASTMRWNTLAASLPLIFLLFRWSPTINGWKRYAVATVAWLGVTVGAGAVNQALTDEAYHYWYSSHAYQDIAGTLEYARPYSDAELREALEGTPLVARDQIQARMRAIYQPWSFTHLRGGDTRIWDFCETAEQRAAVARAWKQILTENPAAYLQYRWDVFVLLMRFDGGRYVNTITAFMPPHEDAALVEHDATYSRAQSVMASAVTPLSETLMFDPYIYLAVSLIVLGLAIGRDRLAAAIVLSGLSYQGAWFLLAPTADYRYSQWMVTTTVLGAIVCFANRRARLAAARTKQGNSQAE
ncbi:MAG: hypothetical protein ABI867_24265 [Kofleriaceae bacterium]